MKRSRHRLVLRLPARQLYRNAFNAELRARCAKRFQIARPHGHVRLERPRARLAAQRIAELEVRSRAHVHDELARLHLRERPVVPGRNPNAIPPIPAFAARRLQERPRDAPRKPARSAAVFIRDSNSSDPHRATIFPRERFLSEIAQRALELHAELARMIVEKQSRPLDEARLLQTRVRLGHAKPRELLDVFHAFVPSQIHPLKSNRKPREEALHLAMFPLVVRDENHGLQFHTASRPVFSGRSSPSTLSARTHFATSMTLPLRSMR